MIILPAIDLKDGRPVRLTKGDFSTTEQVADNALETAKNFEAAGATHLHMVDLDGALEGHPVNHAIVYDVIKNTSLFVEIGGGIRTADHIKQYIDAGVGRVILGSVAINDPDFAKEMIELYGERIAVGIDALNGFAKGGGWLEGSSVRFTDLARAMTDAGAKTIIFTDISKDGTLSGPNTDQLLEVIAATDANIIASGGIATIDDIKAVAELGCYGVICGKSIYKGTLDLKDALAYQ